MLKKKNGKQNKNRQKPVSNKLIVIWVPVISQLKSPLCKEKIIGTTMDFRNDFGADEIPF